MKEYLIATFLFNDEANRKMLEKILALPEKTEAVRYFSHLINSQNKWLQRIKVFPQEPGMDWWEPVYPVTDLLLNWEASLQAWVNYLERLSDDEIMQERKFIGFDGATWSCPLKDIALQLNYHSIHHRAQIQLLIREQGIEPDFIDYIGTKYKRLG